MSLDKFIASCALTDSWCKERDAGPYPERLQALFSDEQCDRAFAEIAQWPNYAPSPIRSLEPLAAALGLEEIRYHDESGRFGLGSFKALGGAYAVIRYLAQRLDLPMAAIRRGQARDRVAELTVATATDGNHGRSVAWGAQLAGCRCKIFIHRHVSQGRQRAMEAFGAEVIRVDGDYDESVRCCADEADKHDWQVISDTSYDGYRDIPRDVMAGYSTIATEAIREMQPPPSHIVLQVGVGGMAAAVAARFWMKLGARCPTVILVEADRAACVIASLRADKPVNVVVENETVMAGLSCGEPSEVAFEILREIAVGAVTIPDDHIAAAMRAMASGALGGEPIEAGECGVPGIVALAAIIKDRDLAGTFDLNPASHVLLIGCEGATDPEIYRSLLATLD